MLSLHEQKQKDIIGNNVKPGERLVRIATKHTTSGLQLTICSILFGLMATATNNVEYSTMFSSTILFGLVVGKFRIFPKT